MLQSLRRWLGRGRVHEDPAQLGFDLASRPEPPHRPETVEGRPEPVRRSAPQGKIRGDESAFLERLRSRGLKSIETVTLTKNSRVMVSFRGNEMRVHRGYLDAETEVLDAIVSLVEGRTRKIRREAGKFVVANAPAGISVEPKRREGTHPDDEAWSARLVEEHRRLNAELFAGALTPIAVRVSRRMKSRLGHYSPAMGSTVAEIAISRRHIRRHGWDDAIETLVHEMVHQWQAESGFPLDHGAAFRKKAVEVGIRPRAKRAV